MGEKTIERVWYGWEQEEEEEEKRRAKGRHSVFRKRKPTRLCSFGFSLPWISPFCSILTFSLSPHHRLDRLQCHSPTHARLAPSSPRSQLVLISFLSFHSNTVVLTVFEFDVNSFLCYSSPMGYEDSDTDTDTPIKHTKFNPDTGVGVGVGVGHRTRQGTRVSVLHSLWAHTRFRIATFYPIFLAK